MKLKIYIRKYFSIVFVLATLLGTIHQHNDINQHNDCQICVIQASIADADTPTEVSYFTKLQITSESIQNYAYHSLPTTLHISIRQRAPPTLS